MEKPVLIIMAAGMGSRYGGLKQIDPVDEYGNIIMDFSVYAAKEAGFEKVIFVIKRENHQAFAEAIGDRLSRYMQVEYAYQELTDLPEGFSVPEGRVKPFGTGQAVLSAAPYVNGPFVVINADDYYGKTAFQKIYDFLTAIPEGETKPYPFAMVGFQVENTVVESGTVSRGVCEVNPDGTLRSVTERTKIRKTEQGAAYTEDNGQTWTEIPAGTTVSMNFWGFTADMMQELKKGFASFLANDLPKNPLKGEFFLPFAVSDLIEKQEAAVTVLSSPDQWYGVTYREDKASVCAALRAQKDAGLYPERLWE